MRTALALLAVLAIGGLAAAAHADAIADRAKRLHAAAIVVDTHMDTPDALDGKWADVATPGATDTFDLARAAAGGLTAPFFSIYVSADYADRGAAKRALELIDLTKRVVDGHPKQMVLATTPAEIRVAKQAGMIAVLMGIEGGHAIEDSLPVLREMYRAGVRYMTLTHTNTNHWADSSGSIWEPGWNPKTTAIHGGLSAFGRDVVTEMNRIGMIVDVSHVSGLSNVKCWLEEHGGDAGDEGLCRHLLAAAKGVSRVLRDDELSALVAEYARSHAGA